MVSKTYEIREKDTGEVTCRIEIHWLKREPEVTSASDLWSATRFLFCQAKEENEYFVIIPSRDSD